MILLQEDLQSKRTTYLHFFFCAEKYERVEWNLLEGKCGNDVTKTLQAISLKWDDRLKRSYRSHCSGLRNWYRKSIRVLCQNCEITETFLAWGGLCRWQIFYFLKKELKAPNSACDIDGWAHNFSWILPGKFYLEKLTLLMLLLDSTKATSSIPLQVIKPSS